MKSKLRDFIVGVSRNKVIVLAVSLLIVGGLFVGIGLAATGTEGQGKKLAASETSDEKKTEKVASDDPGTSNSQVVTTQATEIKPETPADSPAPKPLRDPCAEISADSPVTFPAGITGITSITIPVGCTSATYTISTSDNRSVTWSAGPGGAFIFSDGTGSHTDAPVVAHLHFNDSYAGPGVSYHIVVKGDAAPGAYEAGFFISDPSKPSPFSYSVKINVVAD